MDGHFGQGAALVWQIAMGMGLSACAGLRAFLPLFVAGVAGRLELIPLMDQFEWIASTPALTVFGVAVLTELMADKIPVLDHFLDLSQGLVKPVAGTILATAVLTELPPWQAAALGLIVGGSVAGGVHVAKTKTRLASTLTTAGVGNPLISFVEDVAAFLGSIAAVVVPLVVAALVVAGALLVIFAVRRMRQEIHRPVTS